MKRFRSMFTLRTLAIIVTLVGGYFGAWEATKRYGVEDVRQHALLRASSVTPIAPLILRTHAHYPGDRHPEIRYHFWFFGLVTEVPLRITPADG